MSGVIADEVAKTYGRTTALAGASFSAGTGVTGLLGPNGAGKTTLLRILATVTSPGSGRVRLLGRDPRDAQDRLEIRRRLGYLPQEPGFHRGFTVFEFVDYVAILKEMTDRRERHDEVRRVVDLVGLTDVADRKIRALSGGMRRRVGVAQALLGDPELVVLDEPTAGLDPEQRLRFRDLVSRIGEGRTVILSTHQTEDVAALCPHVVVLDAGRTVFDGTPAGLTSTAEGHGVAVGRAVTGRPAGLADRRRRRTQHRRRGANRRAPAAPDAGGRLPAARRRGRGDGRGRVSAAHDVLGARPEAGPRARLSTPGGLENVFDLARVQSRRILRHPAMLLSLGWLLAGVGLRLSRTRRTSDTRRRPACSSSSPVRPPSSPPNLVATSERRSGADDWTPALPMPPVRADGRRCCSPASRSPPQRSSSTCCSSPSAGPDRVGPALRWAHVASVPVAVLGAAVLGVAVARLLPWPGAPLVVMVGLVAANVWTNDHQPYLGLYVDFAEWTGTDAVPAMDPGSPGWHLVYLVALVGLAACGALLRDVTRRWLPFVGGGGLRHGRARRRRHCSCERRARRGARPPAAGRRPAAAAGRPLAAGAGGRRCSPRRLLWWQSGDLDDPAAAIWLLRVRGADAGGRSALRSRRRLAGHVAASPTPLSARTAGALLVVVLPAALVWAAACTWVVSRPGAVVPVGGLTLEALALGALIDSRGPVAVPLAGRHRPGRTHRTGGRRARARAAAAPAGGPRWSCRPAPAGRRRTCAGSPSSRCRSLLAYVAMSDPGRPGRPARSLTAWASPSR